MKAKLTLIAVCILACLGFAAWKIALWHQVSSFRNLTSAMRAQDVIRTFGKPEKMDGSGRLFLHYRLIDGSEIVVVCASELRVIAVTHNGEMIANGPR